MATPSALAGLPHAAPPGPRRPGRWRLAGLLAVGVLAWHVWLVDRLAPPVAPAGPSRPALVQLRSLPVAPAAALLPAAAAIDVTEAATPMGASPFPTAAPRRAAAGGPPSQDLAPAGQATVADAGQAVIAPGGVTVRSPAGEAAAPAAGPSALAAAGARAAADVDGGPAGDAPPVYPTHLPPPTQLRYTLRHDGQTGEALLAWQHDGQRYQLTLQASTAAGAPLLQQASAGLLDAHGLAPERFTDRRRAGRTQAANFRRDIGQIGYSGPPRQHPAWPGAQDRLSWLAQLVAVLAAAGDAPPEPVTLFVTDALGHAGLWQLRRQPDEQITLPAGTWAARRWLREPPRPEGLRIEAWLPVDPDGPAGPWPLRLRLQVPRSGHLLDLQRAALP